MIRVISFPIALALAATQAGDAMKDLQRIKGEWEVVALAQDGGKQADIKGQKMVFTADKMTYFGEDDRREYSFSLDPSKKPKALDYTCLDGVLKGKSGKGIYHLEGDDLKLCLTNNGSKGSPTEFTSKKNLIVLTLKRKK